ncbi:hypothetical protein RRG40_01110 [Mycoplasmopsis felis]|uniref:hypothetical protein n=1 Tax=Mycoplasmopsis felis TaxID=33923 RepID=UPI002AFF1BD3|nr:hypothetical protein [Mycoplasmopsis felis]WQQ05433.1 hypothetical protein RRG59_03740 [Mycoplasmopsis felis]
MIKKANFLDLNIDYFIINKKNNLVITNPPFGKKANLAIDFLNKSLIFFRYCMYDFTKYF